VNLSRSVSVKSLLKKIDRNRLREIQRRYAKSPDRYTKYAEVERAI